MDEPIFEVGLPHSREAEEAVIGGVFINSDAVNDISLAPSDFYIVRLGMIWKAIMSLRKSGHGIDILTVANRLEVDDKLEDVGGYAYLTSLLNQCPSSYEVPTYARLILDDATRRKMLQAANRVAVLAYDRSKDAQAVLGEAEKELSQIESGGQTKNFTTPQGLRAAMDITDRAIKGKVLTIKTGFYDLDEIVKLQAPDLAIVAGRPGSGKTAWLLTVADNICAKGGRVLLFSMEMSVSQVNMRLIAMHSGISVAKQREGKIKEEDFPVYYSAIEELQNYKLMVNDQSAITLREMRQAIRATSSVDLVMVDYLQLMTSEGRNENRTQEVGRISQGLKAIAKDLSVPVLAAAQLSRAVEGRAEKIPQLSDLRESGSLEQDASIVWFISRAAQESTEAIVTTAKNRDGSIGYCKLQFNGVRTRFQNQTKIQGVP